MPDSLEDGSFWVPVTKATDDRLLRPQWREGWDVNLLGWGRELVKRFYDRGWRISNHMSQEAVENTHILEVEATFMQAFVGQASKYNDAQTEDAQTKLAEKQTKARRHGRKGDKSRHRLGVRHLLPPHMQGPRLDFFFQGSYQSTEESSWVVDSSIDVDTDSEEAAQGDPALLANTVLTFTARAPLYRSEFVSSNML